MRRKTSGDAFGNEETGMKETVSSVQNDIKFTGATLITADVLPRSRHYDPNTGGSCNRIRSRRRIQPVDTETYTPTSNNPVNYIDLTGIR